MRLTVVAIEQTTERSSELHNRIILGESPGNTFVRQLVDIINTVSNVPVCLWGRSDDQHRFVQCYKLDSYFAS